MKTRALGFLLMVAAAGVYAVGCGSSNNNGGTGGAGTGGKGGAAGAGVGGAGAGGKAGAGAGGSGMGGAGMGGKIDGGTDTTTDTGGGTGGKVDGGNTDMAMDMPAGDVPVDGQAAPTFTDVFGIISNVTTPTADTSPGCANCHDGINPADGGAATTLPHSMNFKDKAAAYAALVGVASIRCAGQDAGGDASLGTFDRVHASSAATSVLWQKLNQGVNPSMPACDGVPMPLNPTIQLDGGTVDGAAVDGGSTMTHHAITAAQLKTVMDWINAGALNN